ncbi:MAG: hypothetical protein ACOH5I_12390 [Oligoflexus sp.]
MQNLLKFLDYAGIDPKLYWRTKSIDGEQEFEIQWRRDQDLSWRFRRSGDLFWQMCKTDDLITALQQISIDVPAFESKLRYTILQQVAFADKIVREAQQILGEEAVDQAIRDNQRFLQQLEDVILQMTNKVANDSNVTTKPMLRLISEHDTGKSTNSISSPADY